jgi:hypothetical protein
MQVLSEEGEIAVAVVRSGASIEVDGQRVEADLSLKTVRLIIENVALLAERTEEIESLNR